MKPLPFQAENSTINPAVLDKFLNKMFTMIDCRSVAKRGENILVRIVQNVAKHFTSTHTV